MEVYLSRLPEFLNNKSLKKNLKPFVNDLGITEFDCRKGKNTRHGAIIFSKNVDGEKFLRAYGADPLNTLRVPDVFNRSRGPQRNSKLTICNTNICCERGRYHPDHLTIKAISYNAQKERDQKMWEERQTREHGYHAQGGKTVIFHMLGLQCGHIVYHNGECSFRPDKSWEQQTSAKTPAVAKFAKSHVILKLVNGNKVQIPFNSVHELVVSKSDLSLTFILSETPRFYGVEWEDPQIGNLPAMDILGKVLGTKSHRLTSLGGLHGDTVRTSLVYRVLAYEQNDFMSRVRALKGRHFISDLITFAKMPRIRGNLLEKYPSMQDALRKFDARLGEEKTVRQVPFDILFQLQVLAWNGYLLPGTVVKVLDELQRRINDPTTTIRISWTSIKKMLQDTPFPGPNTPARMFDPDVIISYLEDVEKDIEAKAALSYEAWQENQHHIWIYKALVTPTHTMLLGPELEARNRVLRKYPNHTDYFVRVQFGEEDGGDIRFDPKWSNDIVYRRFKEVMDNGISIAGRQYNFFAFSHSSLRSHSTWFNAPFIHNGTLCFYDTLISGLGDFSKIRVVAKCAARIGQAFSETPYAISMRENCITYRYIADRKSPDGSRVFSDGVGTLSYNAMLAIRDNIPNPRARAATAFQIRFGGSKGMISLDTTLRGREICIRNESMEKFVSADVQDLEICDIASRPMRMVLSRQTIKILEDMGMPANWFLHLQSSELNRLRCVTRTAFNASVFLSCHSIGDTIEFPKFLRRLEKLGLDFRRDRLLSSIVELVVLNELRLLKHKARIPVPLGVTLFGVVDETGFLEKDEVYVTYETWDDRFRSPPEDGAKVLVTRSPALHPGDIQAATNRIPPARSPLRHLANCVVFNRKGDRDMPSMLSGGDLDGDLYHVIWDENAVNQRLRFYSPADYPRSLPKDIGRTVQRGDMANFFIDFMKTDQLGIIATRHMILADQKEKGTLHQNCITLAGLHSAAVDFSKTGIPADVGTLKSIKLSPVRPDFMAAGPEVEIVDQHTIKIEDAAPSPENDDDEDLGPEHQYYLSEKILGQLYRAVDERNIWHESIRTKVARQETNMWDDLHNIIVRESRHYKIGWTGHLEKARRLRDTYNDAVRDAMAANAELPSKPLSETELFIGQFFSKRGVRTGRQRDRSDNLRTTYDRISRAVWRMIREKPATAAANDYDDDDDWSAAGNFSTNTTTASSHASTSSRSRHSAAKNEKEVLGLALACYYASREPSKSRAHADSKRYKLATFKIVAASAFLKELELFQRSEDIRQGVEMLRIRSAKGPAAAAALRTPTTTIVQASRQNVAEPRYIAALDSSLKMIPPQLDI